MDARLTHYLLAAGGLVVGRAGAAPGARRHPGGKRRLLAGAALLAALTLPGVSCGAEEAAPPQRGDVPASVVYTAVRAFPRLSFKRPTFLTAAPGDKSRIFVAEQEGKILVFPNSDDAAEAETFLNLFAKVHAGGEEGLIGLAFDPNYQSNGYFYVHYSAADPRRSVISRFSVTPGDGNRAEPQSEKILLEVPQPFANHNGGMLEFGPDGMLYIGLGDGGSSGDPQGNAQNLGSLLGKILRIDPRGGDPYAIPADNPYLDQPEARGEIWAWGLRNPYRFSFDRTTGELWAGDAGESLREEVDIIKKGRNYSWNLFEGYLEFKIPLEIPDRPFTAPLFDYGRERGTAVVGGYVYRGSAAPSLRDDYIYGDYGSGRVWALTLRGQAVLANTEIARVPALSSFGEDGNGELYLVSLEGLIYRLEERLPN